MFKQVFRVAFVTLIWKQYKQLIVSTLLLFAYLFLVSSIHSDFLTHATMQNESGATGRSFVYKWLAFIGGVAVYFLYHYTRNKKLTKPPKDPSAKQKAQQKAEQQQRLKELVELEEADDPFASIRKREKLRGRADFMMNKKD